MNFRNLYINKILSLLFLLVIFWSERVSPCPNQCLCYRLKANCTDLSLKNEEINETFTAEIPQNIENIDLSRNNLTKLPLSLFQRFTKLKELVLDHNKFRNIPRDLSTHLPNLKTLHMRDNELETATITGSLNKAYNLRKLHLDGNKIQTLDSKMFKKNTKLVQLDLSRNIIDKIDERAFQSLQNLQFINISKNLISELKTSLFKTVTRLESVSFAYNSIKIIPESLFRTTHTHLNVINFHKNSIRDLKPALSFLKLPYLKVLDLSGNNITLIPTDFIKNTTRKIGLEMNLLSNPINCSCELLTSIAEISMHNINITAQCWTPRKLYKWFFSNITTKKLNHKNSIGRNMNSDSLENANLCKKITDKNIYHDDPKKQRRALNFKEKCKEIGFRSQGSSHRLTNICEENNGDVKGERQNNSVAKSRELVMTILAFVIVLIIGGAFAVWYYNNRVGREMCSKNQTRCCCYTMIILYIGLLLLLFEGGKILAWHRS